MVVSRMRTRFWKLFIMLAGFVMIGCYAAAQANVTCNPIGGVIIENFNPEFAVGEGFVVLGVISGDLSGGTFFVAPPSGSSAEITVQGVITLNSGDTLRVQSQLTVGDDGHISEQVAILSGTGAYQRASGSYEANGSQQGGIVKRYQGEVCTPAR